MFINSIAALICEVAPLKVVEKYVAYFVNSL